MESLGLADLSQSVIPASKKRKAPTPKATPVKRVKKSLPPDPSSPASELSEATPEPSGRRRSARNAGKSIDYSKEVSADPKTKGLSSRLPRLVSVGEAIERESTTEYVGNKLGARTEKPLVTAFHKAFMTSHC